ncbi:hypothetical protein BAUCODRAFT_376560 [Baudoinia panamericana UAMH 10762]|uniref:Uncharacterized protein n=1 Tax=Baudoinia panamericana (strain UAMH 10762) TaxID=717646 RepID=M2NH38_BAUPA|nr:uncharacterized protein BAUCODRAFT_376560 [Baudoinia panamericana UAMH 10762]EMC98644.1 hypothetical protein BAUCODRAFT_376560 [Baudoinia panamericana UAMH 10762]
MGLDEIVTRAEHSMLMLSRAAERSRLGRTCLSAYRLGRYAGEGKLHPSPLRKRRSYYSHLLSPKCWCHLAHHSHLSVKPRKAFSACLFCWYREHPRQGDQAEA